MSLGPYTLDNVCCGECTAMMSALPDCCIDLTVTSPPYDNQRKYKGFIFDFEPIACQLYRVTKEGGVVVWVVGDATNNGSESGTSFRQALHFMEIGFRLHDTMIYAKRNYVPLTHNRYEQQFEYMFVLSKGKPKVFNPLMIPCGWKRQYKTKHLQNHAATAERRSAMRAGKRRRADEVFETKDEKYRPNIWFYKIGGVHTGDVLAFEHPAAFPEKLARDHIVSWSNPGDVIFDPMCGSGTTLKMALQLNRHFLGFDISPEYVELSKKRISQVQIDMFNSIEV